MRFNSDKNDWHGEGVTDENGLYLATSQIFGDEDAGFDDSSEYLVGMNFYPANTRNHRLNVQVMDVNGSPVSSTFGYYTGGQDGTTVSVAFSIFF